MRLVNSIIYFFTAVFVWASFATLILFSIIAVSILAVVEDIVEAFKVKRPSGVLYYSEFEKHIKKERVR